MIELRRVSAGIFDIKDSHTIEEIKKAVDNWKLGDENKLKKILIPAEVIKQVITSVQVKEDSLKPLLNGKPLMKQDISNKLPNSELISVFCRDKFIGIYKIEQEKESDIVAKPEFVKN